MMEVEARSHSVKEVEALSKTAISRNIALNKRMEKAEAGSGNGELEEDSLWLSHISSRLASKILIAFVPDHLSKMLV